MSNQTSLSLALCLFPGVTSLDYQGPLEQLSFLFPENLPHLKAYAGISVNHTIEATYLSHTLEPVRPTAGPLLVPTRTYDSVKADEQFDIILIPGGPTARPGGVPDALLDFIKRQEPGAKHILTVCTGSWVLAATGLLRGKRATSNKASFKAILEDTRGQGIEWVAVARFVINDDNKIWTSSGVTAGADMGSAFLDYLIGKDAATRIRGVVELTAKEAGDDEFAKFHGLV